MEISQERFPFATPSKGRPNSHRADFSFLRPLKATPVFQTYWEFAAKRQSIFLKRARGLPAPWSDDAILLEYKFTNAYRASDRVSQYLIRNVIDSGDQTPIELFFRIILFKLFNRIGTWELLKRRVGNITFGDYRFERFDKALTDAMAKGDRLYSAAYIMPSGGSKSPFKRKHGMHLSLLEKMMRDELPSQIADASTMTEAFQLLRAYPTIGDFLAYQYVTDLNYSTLTQFSESEFTVAGPGALDGIAKCFSDLGGLTECEVISFVTARQEECCRAAGVQLATLWGRRLQLIDCQNLFCEVGKYARVAHPEVAGCSGRTRIKQKFKSSPKPLDLWYPPKWGINHKLADDPEYVPHS